MRKETRKKIVLNKENISDLSKGAMNDILGGTEGGQSLRIETTLTGSPRCTGNDGGDSDNCGGSGTNVPPTQEAYCDPGTREGQG